MLRKIRFIACILLLALVFSSCAVSSTNPHSIFFDNLLTEPASIFSKIYTDDETGVMYLSYSVGNQRGITTMINSDTSPKLSKNSSFSTEPLPLKYCTFLVDDETGVLYLFLNTSYFNGLATVIDESGLPRQAKDTQYKTTRLSDTSFTILVDEEEDNMYLVYGGSTSVGITQMVNADGSPKHSKDSSYETETFSDHSLDYLAVFSEERTGTLYLICSKSWSHHRSSPYPHSKVEYEGDMVVLTTKDGAPKHRKGTNYPVHTFLEHPGTVSGTAYYGTDPETEVTYVFYWGYGSEGGGVAPVVG